jgi:hypothetical protein
MRLPTGFSPGQCFRASAWLTITTGGASSTSASVNVRPATTGMPRAANVFELAIESAAEGRSWLVFGAVPSSS